MEPQPAKLCARCQLLEFDDEKEGGEVALTPNGGEYLTLPTRWYTRDDDDPGFWVLKVPRDDIEADESMFTDTLPLLPGLESSAREGCEFCALLRNTILAQANDEKVDPAEGIRTYLSQETPCKFSMYWMWFNESVEKYGLPLGLLCLKNGPADSNVCIWLRTTPGHTTTNWADKDSITWSRRLIDWCSSAHGHATDSFRPKRLIDVQTSPARLVRSQTLDSPPDYAALSYCWGSETDAQSQLTLDSGEAESQFSQQIDEKRLPAVARDAIATTRSLSIPYLWVDALCIRQDQRSPGEDWEEHTGVMDRIYGNALVTIGALSSPSCQDTFLLPQSAVYINFRSTLRPQVAGLLKLEFVDALMNNRAGDHNTPQKQVLWTNTLEKWNMRGWSAMEQLSSTSLLAFGRRNLFFSCPSGSWYFGGPDMSFNSLMQYGLDRTRPALWREIVGWYSARTGRFHNRPLGFADITDTFPTISSLARSYAAEAKLSESDYVAGLWKSALPGDLLWTMNDPHTVTASTLASHLDLLDAKPYISPSWSWANRGKVSQALLDDEDGRPCSLKPEYDSVDTHVVLRGEDPLGAISYAELRVTGTVAPIPGRQMITVEKEEVTVTTNMNDYQPRIWVSVTPPGGHQWQFSLDWEPEGKSQDTRELRMLVLGSFEMSGGERGLAGLLIRAVDGEVRGHQQGDRYKRVGAFRSDDGEQPPGSMQRFLLGGTQDTVVVV
ncbi:heterokaryon incompatibility protein-domain-containing protein [Cercophora newfieldiana]|uniref:Heterokaryon incompatibility protein-domain-containing protein n=1 Tax=Cercophora newfieldiana TaxID=92897 RepID=A0AA39YIA4_9PEZI|nr:heterokaryon incompatibility protein-domain-containing protein [Cercophora newfieldiana]